MFPACLAALLVVAPSAQTPFRIEETTIADIQTALRGETLTSTLGELLGLDTVTEDELYESMDWLRARQEKIEDGSVVRLDSTVTGALMHEPSDSSLLWDAVRVMVRLLKQAQRWMGDLARAWRDHRRAAKKRWQAIEFTRGRPKRVPLYRALIRIVRTTLAYMRAVATRLTASMNPAVALWRAKVRHYEPLVESVIAQSERRVLHGEAVPAREKLVSLFETHADIIVKRRRNVRYGHKLNLTTGRSGLILDLGDRGRQPGRQRPAHADAGAPHRRVRRGAASGGGGWRFCQPQEPGSREGVRGARHGLSQEVRPQHRRYGPQPLGLSPAAQLPGRDRGRHLLPQAGLRLGPLHLARARPLQGLCLVLGGGLQPRCLRSPAISLTPFRRTNKAASWQSPGLPYA